MKLEGKVTNIRFDYRNKQTIFECSTSGDITSSLAEFLDKELNIEIKKHSPRSLTANGYVWALLGELQEKLKIPKEDLYREYIRRCGRFEVIPIRTERLSAFIDVWTSNGLGWVCDTTPSKLEGYTNVLAYYGSSAYNSTEMEFLLSNIIDDCIEFGVPTKKKEDIESLLKEWR